MKTDLPYMNAPGYITKVLDKIVVAQTPPKFTQDFLSTVLGVGSSSARPIIPFLKRLGILASDGSPTELYAQFRTDSTRGIAAAKALSNGYEPLFESNEYVYKLDDSKLKDMITQLTGAEKGSKSIKSIVSSFNAVKEYADFDSLSNNTEHSRDVNNEGMAEFSDASHDSPREELPSLGLSYTINLNLPATSDIAVFDAIFKSLKDHLLK